MTAPFDWDRLAQKIFDMVYEDMDEAAAAYLRERIEAAFVPVEDYRQLERLHDGLQDVAQGLTARAEAAEARVKVLEEALDSVMVGGNHLALLIGVNHPAYGTDHYAALQHYGAGDQYEVWCAWDAIMLARKALGGEHE